VGNRRQSGAGEFKRIVLTAVDSRCRPLWSRPLAGARATAALAVDDGRDGSVIAGFARLPGGWGETAVRGADPDRGRTGRPKLYLGRHPVPGA